MSENNIGMKILVTAETAEAEKGLDDIASKAEEVKNLSHSRSSSSSSTSRGINPPNGGSGPNSVSDKQAKKAGEEFGRSAAGAITKAAAGFLLHDLSGTLFKWARTPGEDNTSVDRANASMQGAVALGTAGAMAGGVWGGAIGAVVGALNGLAGQLAEERNARRQTAIGIWQNSLAANEGVNSRIGNFALSRLMEFTGSRFGKDELLRANLKEQAQLLAAAANRLKSIQDKSSTAYQYASGEHSRIAGLYGQTLGEWALHRLNNMTPERVSASDVTDSWSRRGIYYGREIDIASVNDSSTRHADMMSALREIVSATNQGTAANGERLQALLETIVKVSTL